ncbi:hypothetical protein PSECIP111951_00559 [Pseudoalteromonas holothuriae]|uniref:Uncharacterized protein n=1 Tax=Pseudoalteromonas holothuriae TaxID=2963714 RepID=A0ABN8UGZ9_9GAMM|nr:hypothetical protein [Pseudoalteromonas sp. CIP111951]CAH9052156.1 hypothetical protein PSECIP111951_00559 [Pseudoalteromonas sp. CIP111951]
MKAIIPILLLLCFVSFNSSARDIIACNGCSETGMKSKLERYAQTKNNGRHLIGVMDFTGANYQAYQVDVSRTGGPREPGPRVLSATVTVTKVYDSIERSAESSARTVRGAITNLRESLNGSIRLPNGSPYTSASVALKDSAGFNSYIYHIINNDLSSFESALLQVNTALEQLAGNLQISVNSPVLSAASSLGSSVYTSVIFADGSSLEIQIKTARHLQKGLIIKTTTTKNAQTADGTRIPTSKYNAKGFRFNKNTVNMRAIEDYLRFLSLSIHGNGGGNSPRCVRLGGHCDDGGCSITWTC